MTRRVAIFRNTGPAPRWKRGTIRHRGTVQRLFWVGPLFVVLRNRASARAAAKAASACICWELGATGVGQQHTRCPAHPAAKAAS